MSTVLYCTVLYSTVLHCTVLYCNVLFCNVLYCAVLHCEINPTYTDIPLYCIVVKKVLNRIISILTETIYYNQPDLSEYV